MTSGSPSRRRICGGRWRGYDWTVSSDISAVFRMKFYVFRKFYYLCTSIPAQSDIRRPGTYTGEMLEWLKRHAWKACIRQNRISGSNPDLSAINAKNQQITKKTPNFTPNNVKLGVFFFRIIFKLLVEYLVYNINLFIFAINSRWREKCLSLILIA